MHSLFHSAQVLHMYLGCLSSWSLLTERDFLTGSLSWGNTSAACKMTTHLAQTKCFSSITHLCAEISPFLNGCQCSHSLALSEPVCLGRIPSKASSVTEPSLSALLLNLQKIPQGWNNHRWGCSLTVKWNYPILYKHYITASISWVWQWSTFY